MARVTGVGGTFFAADDPENLPRWYEQHLGIAAPPASYDIAPWQQSAGPCIVAPMSAGGAHVRNGWSVNFRVDDLDDLDELVEQLRAAGVEVDVDTEDYPNGRFAELTDPEGNLVQLWDPR